MGRGGGNAVPSSLWGIQSALDGFSSEHVGKEKPVVSEGARARARVRERERKKRKLERKGECLVCIVIFSSKKTGQSSLSEGRGCRL